MRGILLRKKRNTAKSARRPMIDGPHHDRDSGNGLCLSRTHNFLTPTPHVVYACCAVQRIARQWFLSYWSGTEHSCDSMLRLGGDSYYKDVDIESSFFFSNPVLKTYPGSLFQFQGCPLESLLVKPNVCLGWRKVSLDTFGERIWRRVTFTHSPIQYSIHKLPWANFRIFRGHGNPLGYSECSITCLARKKKKGKVSN
jgi:hypothetical protein